MRLALAGQLFSGKSTLARALADRGFTSVNYTDYLKQLACKALRAGLGQDLTVQEMHADKERYRPFIIALGTLAGFDRGNYVQECLDDAVEQADLADTHDDRDQRAWAADGLPRDIVWDCVRFPAQYARLIPFGFRLVRCAVPDAVRFQRAVAVDLDLRTYLERLGDPSEAPLPPYPGEVQITVDGDMDAVINTLTGQVLQAELAEKRVERSRAGAGSH